MPYLGPEDCECTDNHGRKVISGRTQGVWNRQRGKGTPRLQKTRESVADSECQIKEGAASKQKGSYLPQLQEAVAAACVSVYAAQPRLQGVCGPLVGRGGLSGKQVNESLYEALEGTEYC